MIKSLILIGVSALSPPLPQSERPEAIYSHYLEQGRYDDRTGVTSIERIDLDINGDGRPEIMLSDSGRYWRLYSQDDKSFAFLRPLWFLYLCLDEVEGFWAVHADGVGLEGTVGHYRLEGDPPRMTTVSSRDLLPEIHDEYYRIRACHKQLEEEGIVTRATVSDLNEARKGYAELWTGKKTRRPVSGLARIVDSPSEVPASAAAVLQYSPDDSWQEEKNLAEHFAWASQLLPKDTSTVFLFQLDVTADGVPELFIQRQRGGGIGSYWHVYTPAGQVYRYLGVVPLERLDWRFDEETGLLITEQFRIKKLAVYKIDETGIYKTEVEPPTEYEEQIAYRAAIKAWRGGAGPQVLRVAMKDFARGLDADWRDAETHKFVSPPALEFDWLVENLDPEDKKRPGREES